MNSPFCAERFFSASDLMEHREKVHGFDGFIYDSLHPWFDSASGSEALGGNLTAKLKESLSTTRVARCPHLVQNTSKPRGQTRIDNCSFITTDMKLMDLHRIAFHGYLHEHEPRDSIHPWLRKGKLCGGNLDINYVKWWRRTNWHLHHPLVEDFSDAGSVVDPISTDSISVKAEEDDDSDFMMASQVTDSMDVDVATPRISDRTFEESDSDPRCLSPISFIPTPPPSTRKLSPESSSVYYRSLSEISTVSIDSRSASPAQVLEKPSTCRFCIPKTGGKCIISHPCSNTEDLGPGKGKTLASSGNN